MKQRTILRKVSLGKHPVIDGEHGNTPVEIELFQVFEQVQGQTVEKVMAEAPILFPNGNYLRVLSTSMRHLCSEVEFLMACRWRHEHACRVSEVEDPLSLWNKIINIRPDCKIHIAAS